MNRAGLELFTDLGRRGTIAAGDPLENAHLFQRLSICTQRLKLNVIAFRGTSIHNTERSLSSISFLRPPFCSYTYIYIFICSLCTCICAHTMHVCVLTNVCYRL